MSYPLPPSSGHRALRRGRVSLPGHYYHVTTATHHRRPLFEDFSVARAVIRSLNTPALLKDNELLAWVLMPDHLHVLLRLGERDSLQSFVDRLKSATARSVNRLLGRTGGIWQRAYHDHLLRDDEDFKAVGRYIVLNPLRAALVQRVADYSHWDAIWV